MSKKLSKELTKEENKKDKLEMAKINL